MTTATLAVALALATGAGRALAGQFELNSNGSYVPATAEPAHTAGRAAEPTVAAA